MSASEVRRRKKPQAEVNETSTSPSPVANHHSKKKNLESNDNPSQSTKSSSAYDEYAWFIVFLLALSYFILTRTGSTNRNNGLVSKFSKPYKVVVSTIKIGDASDKKKNEETLKSIFYIQKKTNRATDDTSNELVLTLSHPLEVIISSPPDIIYDNNNNTNNVCQSTASYCTQDHTPFLSHLISTTWIHDPELGRGYLLMADVGRSGRIWRWEVGGGPITIGRSLHMERSGCRSGIWVEDGKSCPDNLFGYVSSSTDQGRKESTTTTTSTTTSGFEYGQVFQSTSPPPLLGTASIIVELQRDAERSTEGKNILVAEWGERRIVRVEGETGARTPLVTMLPGEGGDERRLSRPNHLMYTPFGDLLFSDSYESNEGNRVAAIYRLREAVHVPAISVEQSREAHGWTHTTVDGQLEDDSIDIIFQIDGWIDGMALGGSDHSTVFVSVVAESESSWVKTVYKLSLAADENTDDDDAEPALNASTSPTVIYRIESKECRGSNDENHNHIGSKVAIDERGTIYLVTCPSDLTLLSSKDGHVIGSLSLSLDQSHTKMHPSPITSVDFGEDGYIYLTTRESLMRVRSRVKEHSIPTNLVVPRLSKTVRRDKRDKR